MDLDEVNIRDIAVKPLRFDTELRQNPDGTYREVDKVELARVGSAHSAVTVQYIKHIQGTPLWDIIFPFYDAWKKGQDAPVNGTPLDAWPAMSRDKIAVLKMHNVATVEDIAHMTSTVAHKIPLPDMDNLILSAKRFMDARDSHKLENALAEKDLQMSEMESRMKEMEAMLRKVTGGEPEAPKKRGRPPKEKQDDPAADGFEPQEVDVG